MYYKLNVCENWKTGCFICTSSHWYFVTQICTTGEEESLKVVQSYDDLSRKLWQLEGLPLSITSVQGAHQALRYTQVSHLLDIFSCVMYSSISLNFLLFLICPLQVFPPVPVRMDCKVFDRNKNRLGLLPREDKPCPYYITPIKGTFFHFVLKGFS